MKLFYFLLDSHLTLVFFFLVIFFLTGFGVSVAVLCKSWSWRLFNGCNLSRQLYFLPFLHLCTSTPNRLCNIMKANLHASSFSSLIFLYALFGKLWHYCAYNALRQSFLNFLVIPFCIILNRATRTSLLINLFCFCLLATQSCTTHLHIHKAGW
jgi:hypothetical protein